MQIGGAEQQTEDFYAKGLRYQKVLLSLCPPLLAIMFLAVVDRKLTDLAIACDTPHEGTCYSVDYCDYYSICAPTYTSGWKWIEYLFGICIALSLLSRFNIIFLCYRSSTDGRDTNFGCCGVFTDGSFIGLCYWVMEFLEGHIDEEELPDGIYLLAYLTMIVSSIWILFILCGCISCGAQNTTHGNHADHHLEGIWDSTQQPTCNQSNGYPNQQAFPPPPPSLYPTPPPIYQNYPPQYQARNTPSVGEPGLNSRSIADEIQRFAELQQQGIITDQEFQRIKANLLKN